MGAGFASGKEIWQFFGVFGIKGVLGIILTMIILICLGIIIVSIAYILNTTNICKIILPFDNSIAEKVIGFVVASFLFLVYFSMLAAGGALIRQQFGIHNSIGGLILMLLIALTTIKGFNRVSNSLGKLTPILFIVTIGLALFLIAKGYKNIFAEQVISASPLASNWFIASIVFVSYNLMSAIPILANCAYHSESIGTARKGVILGGTFLGICAILLYLATMTDPLLSESSPLPMLSLSQRISETVQSLYSLVLLIAIFGTATSCFFGFCTKIPEGNNKICLIWISAIIGFGFSLMGFSNIVGFLYPIEGYVCLFLITIMIWNYIQIKVGKRK